MRIGVDISLVVEGKKWILRSLKKHLQPSIKIHAYLLTRDELELQYSIFDLGGEIKRIRYTMMLD